MLRTAQYLATETKKSYISISSLMAYFKLHMSALNEMKFAS